MILMNVSTSGPQLGVKVKAFTEHQGELGAAELSGQIQVGDIVTMVNDRSTAGLDFADVLDLVVATARPITIHFERRPGSVQPMQSVQREKHYVWARSEIRKSVVSDPARGSTSQARPPDNNENQTYCAIDSGCSVQQEALQEDEVADFHNFLDFAMRRVSTWDVELKPAETELRNPVGNECIGCKQEKDWEQTHHSNNSECSDSSNSADNGEPKDTCPWFDSEPAQESWCLPKYEAKIESESELYNLWNHVQEPSQNRVLSKKYSASSA